MKELSSGRNKLCILLAMLALAALPALTGAAPLPQEDDPQAQADKHFDAGWAYVNAGDVPAALREFEQALSLYQAVKDRKGEANALLSLGWIELNSGQAGSALTHFEAALPLWQELNVPDLVKNAQSGMAAALTDVAREKAAAGQHDQALGDLARALELYRTLGDKRQAFVLNEIAQVQIAAARYPEAEATLRQTLELCRAAQDRQCEIAALNNLGEVYDSLGKYADALTQHKLAQELCGDAVECAPFAADILANIGRDYINLGDYEKALEYLHRALSAAQALNDQQQEATILNSIGATYTRLAMYDEALTQYEAARDLAQAIEFAEGEEAADINIGDLYHQTGRFQDALREYQAAGDLAVEISDLEGQATTLGNVGSVYADWGQYEEAIRNHQAALDIWQRIGHLGGQATSHNNLGVIMVCLGQYEAAERHYKTAADLRMQIGNPYGIAVTAGNLGDLYFQLGRFGEALQQFTTARDLARSIGAQAVEATELDNMGTAQAKLGQYEAALLSHRDALAIRRLIGDRSGEGTSQANIGAVYSDQKRYPDALAQYEIALQIFQDTGELANQAQVLANAGRVFQYQGNMTEAIRCYQDAVDLNESVQEAIKVEELASAFAAGRATLYSRLIETLVATGDRTAAFDYAERARARAFLDQMGNQRVDLRTDAVPELTEQEQALRQQIIGLQNALNAERARPPDEQSRGLSDNLSADLEQARGDYQELLTRLKLASPEYASLVSVNALTLEEVQSQVLDEYTTLVEYFVMDEQTLAWVVDRDGFELVRLDIAGDELRNQVQFLRLIIARRDFDQATASELYQKLIAPLKPHIGHANLVIVPHGVLHYLPFAALWDAEGERYLIEEYALTYAPSASVLRFILDKRNPDEGRLLALGDPDGSLPHAADEVKAVASLYGTTFLLREDAKESQVYAQAGQLDLLHLAAHGVYNPFNPLFTRIELAPDDAQDGNLEVHEVFGLDLRGSNLVVLSACKTSLGEQSAGDELVGLTRAFLYAGTPAVVTTLWPIHDEASGVLMASFYRHLRAGLTNAEALRAAQLEVLAQEQWRTPYTWAAFALTGDYRGSGEGTIAPEGMPEPTGRPAKPTPPTAEGPKGGLCASAALPLGMALLAGVCRRRTRRIPTLPAAGASRAARRSSAAPPTPGPR